MTDNKRIGFLDVIVQSRFALNERFKFAFKDHFGDFFFGSKSCRILVGRSLGDRDDGLEFVENGGPYVASMLVLSAHVLGYALKSINESVSLLVVAAVEDMTLQFGAIASELGWWLALL